MNDALSNTYEWQLVGGVWQRTELATIAQTRRDEQRQTRTRWNVRIIALSVWALAFATYAISVTL